MFSKTLLALFISSVFTTAAFADNHMPKESEDKNQASAEQESTDMPASPHQANALAEIENRFKMMDSDGDGQISKEESASDEGLTMKWVDLDSDQSDSLSQDEFSVHQQEVLAMESEVKFKELDSNADGAISQDEASQHSALSQQWDDLDSDKSGHLNQEEFSMFQEEPEDGKKEESQQ